MVGRKEGEGGSKMGLSGLERWPAGSCTNVSVIMRARGRGG